MHTEYELILAVDELTPEQEDAIYDEYDALIASHGATTRLTVTVDGSVLDGAHRLLAFLRGIGARPDRFVEDFVARADIALRAGVSRQAVGLWARGERQSDFPPPYSPVAGGIWLFGELDEWLHANLPSYDAPDLGYPSRADHVALASLLLETQSSVPSADSSWTSIALSIDAAAPALAPARVDRHEHTWSQVAQVRAVDVTLAA